MVPLWLLIQNNLMVKEITNKYGTLGQEVAQKVGSIRYKILVNHL